MAADMLKKRTVEGKWTSDNWGRVTTGTCLALKHRVMVLWASPLFNRNNDQSRWQNAYSEMKADLTTINNCGYGLYQTGDNINGSDFANQFVQTTKNPEAVFVVNYNTTAILTGIDDAAKNNSWERMIRPDNTGGNGYAAGLMLVQMFPMADGKLPAGLNADRMVAEPPRDAAHGDAATNAALVMANQAGMKPRQFAEILAEGLKALPIVDNVEIAGPGFVNLRLSKAFWDSIVNCVCTLS